MEGVQDRAKLGVPPGSCWGLAGAAGAPVTNAKNDGQDRKMEQRTSIATHGAMRAWARRRPIWKRQTK